MIKIRLISGQIRFLFLALILFTACASLVPGKRSPSSSELSSGSLADQDPNSIINRLKVRICHKKIPIHEAYLLSSDAADQAWEMYQSSDGSTADSYLSIYHSLEEQLEPWRKESLQSDTDKILGGSGSGNDGASYIAKICNL